MSQVTDTDPDRHPVDVLAEEFAERCRRGERPSVSDYARLHPELADELRQVLPPIALMEKLKHRNRSGNADAAAAPLKLERLGDFHVLREVGRGGMGVVFEAEQESLGRHVALKVLSRASLLDPQRVRRFEEEARAAANLHHTNIVPVFGVGQDEGLHYYVMQFIAGRALSDVIAQMAAGDHPGSPSSARTAPSGSKDGTPSNIDKPIADGPAPAPADLPRGRRYWQWVAQVGRQVAEALDYAHRQGILHRDVKPANLILDDRGNVWVTDFGLAKLASLPEVTQSGDVIGTLQYLAPEALRSQTDKRSDIYGLGITLYELLTLRPAYDEKTPAALMRKVAESDPPRPRGINPRIPQDLENIVVKATSRDPELRYRTAGELAEDLDNFIHDRPIAARRAHAGERLWRWCRRNRLTASLTATAAACAVVALVAGWIAYGTTRRALADEANRRVDAEIARRTAESARRHADANVALSLRSFEEIFNRLTTGGSQPPPPNGRDDPQRTRKETQDAALLKSILSFYDQFAAQNSTNGQLEFEAARAYRRVGDSYFWLWQDAAADAAYRRAAGLFSNLLLSDPNSAVYAAGLVEATMRLGARQPKLDPADAALLHRGTQIAEGLHANQPHNAHYAELAAQILLRDGQLLRAEGDLPTAEARLRAAIAAWKSARPPEGEAPAPRPPGPPPRPMQCTECWLELAVVLIATARPDAGRAAVREAFEESRREASALRPDDQQLSDAITARIAATATKLNDPDLAARARRPTPRRGPPDRPFDFPPPDGPRGPHAGLERSGTPQSAGPARDALNYSAPRGPGRRGVPLYPGVGAICAFVGSRYVERSLAGFGRNANHPLFAPPACSQGFHSPA